MSDMYDSTEGQKKNDEHWEDLPGEARQIQNDYNNINKLLHNTGGYGAEGGANAASSAGQQAAGAAAEAGGAVAGGAAANAGAEAAAGAAEAAGTAGAEAAGGAAAEAGAETAIQAAGAAAAPETAGLSYVAAVAIAAGLKAAKSGAKEISGIFEKGSAEEDYKIFSAGSVIALIILIIFVAVICGTSIRRNTSSHIENHTETQYGNQEDEPHADDNYKFTNDEPENIKEEYDYDVPNKVAALKYKDATNTAVKKAFTEQMISIVDVLDSYAQSLYGIIKSLIDGYVYAKEDRKLTIKSLYENPYPYSTAKSGGSFYKIGNYLAAMGFGGDAYGVFEEEGYSAMPEDKINDDLNFDEVNAVMTEGNKYNTDNSKLEEYIKLFTESEKAMSNMYEMKAVTTFYGYYYLDVEEDDGEGGTRTVTKKFRTGDHEKSPEGPKEEAESKGSEIEYPIHYYFKITVKPFGLHELYELSGANPKAKFQFKYHTNIEHLDTIEQYDRLWCRMDEDGDGTITKEENYLGPSYADKRDHTSTIFGEGMDMEGNSSPVTTGRSAWVYIPVEDQLDPKSLSAKIKRGYRDDDDDDGGDDDDDGRRMGLREWFIDKAIKNCYYSQDGDKRLGQYVDGPQGRKRCFDCSGLVYCGYKEVLGMTFGMNTAEQIANLEGQKKVIMYNSDFDESKLRVGDLLYYKHPGGGRHVKVYVGAGDDFQYKYVHASTPSTGVVGSNTGYASDLYCVARPLGGGDGGDEDWDLLSRIIYCEAGNQGDDGMVAVGEVVMNRVNSPLFPNTIHDVAYAPNQFASKSRWYDPKWAPSPEAINVAQRVIAGERLWYEPTVIGFKVANDTNPWNGWTWYAHLGAHNFYTKGW